MKKLILATTITVSSAASMAFDMSEWTRNGQKEEAPKTVAKPQVQAEPQQQAIAQPQMQQHQVQQPQMQQHQVQQPQIQQHQVQQPQIQPYQQQRPVQQYQQQRPVQQYQAQQQSNTMASEDELQRQIERAVNSLTQKVNNIRVPVSGLSGDAQRALNMYNNSLQQIAFMWGVSDTAAAKQAIDLSLYNFAVGCVSKTGATYQARSILAQYGQISELAGLMQVINKRGKSLGSPAGNQFC